MRTNPPVSINRVTFTKRVLNGNFIFRTVINCCFTIRFVHPYTRFFIITANVHIKATSPKGLALSLVSDGARLLASSSGILHQRTGIPSARVQSYSLAGILELPADQPLFLYIHLSNQEDFEILTGTRISATATQPDYPAFSVVINEQVLVALIPRRSCSQGIDRKFFLKIFS